MSDHDEVESLSPPQQGPRSPSLDPDIFSEGSLTQEVEMEQSDPTTPPPLDQSGTRPIPKRGFWVEIPPLPEHSQGYSRRPPLKMPEPKETSGTETPDVVAKNVVGEAKIDGTRYLYAMMSTRVVHKVEALEMKRLYPHLVERYDALKREGLLAYFDPSGAAVRPSDRAPKGGKRKGTAADLKKKSRRSDESSSAELSDFDEPSESGGDSDNYEEDSATPLRRSHRAVIKQSHGYSPKKALRASLRQTRSTKRVSSGHSSAIDVDDISDDDYDDRYSRPSLKIKIKMTRRKREVQPGFGVVRSIEELDYESDRETASLRAHRADCEKCGRVPAHLQLLKLSKRKGRKRKLEEFEDDEEDVATALGGWVRCLHCSVSAHWKCLASPQRDDVLRAIRELDNKAAVANGDDPNTVVKKKALDVKETTEFICGSCSRGGICMGCKEVAVKLSKPSDQQKSETILGATVPTEASTSTIPSTGRATSVDTSQTLPPSESSEPLQDGASKERSKSAELVFRCKLCKRPSHYDHLHREPDDEDVSTPDLAETYQRNGWRCHECLSWQSPLDLIIAWRPYPADAVEAPLAPDEVINHKSALPREYLVKWQERSYRRAEWVPHQWLVSTNAAKLKNFINRGTSVELLPPNHEDVISARRLQDSSQRADGQAHSSPGRHGRSAAEEENQEQDVYLGLIPDAELRIPSGWKTIDRVLDVLFWKPVVRSKRKAGKGKGKHKAVADSDDEDDDEDSQARAALEDGEEPPTSRMETAEQRKARLRREVTGDDVVDVVWAYVKWQDLGYEQATWDSPPSLDSMDWENFKRAYEYFLTARDVKVPRLSAKLAKERDTRAQKKFTVLPQPNWAQPGTLMPFQLEGITWLWQNWWNHRASILADEMGLGKTVQIVTFIGRLVKERKTFPALVVVPNSTITNWVREFEKWAPGIRVVPYAGEAKARDIIRSYELQHPDGSWKYHVLIATYEAVTNPRDFNSIFKSVPRWEVLVIDEGQRLKNDTNLLVARLDELTCVHRIIMTGTPLNNNIRELFNLMHFLDPDEWEDLPGMEKEYEVLTEEKVADLKTRLKPYFLRRTKAEVMKDLPPKREVIVPVTMTPLQKEVYKSILSQNAHFLEGIRAAASTSTKQKKASMNLNNILMQLRKCMQHPYLVDSSIERTGLSDSEAHKQLVDTSAKMRLLKSMLPKLKARGHRVLLFSQFVIALNIIEDFLVGEGYKFLRLDGDTKQMHRQRDMDEFNKPNSDIFIFLLSTRAGGVGINLWSADTVIVYDPDFNPHQDMQAIARAHRMGQTKPVLVFKLMMKNAAEEKMVQDGKKKLALDHVIVQRMDDDVSKDLQSIFTFGAKALFEETDTSTDIVYTEADVDQLIERVETQEDEVADSSQSDGLSFGFAKVWEQGKGSLAEVTETALDNNDADDFWAKVLEKNRANEAKLEEEKKMGRGARRVAAKKKPVYVDPDLSPIKPAGKRKTSPLSDKGSEKDVNYNLSDADANSDYGSRSSRASRPASALSDLAGSPSKKTKKEKPSRARLFDLFETWRAKAPTPAAPQPSIPNPKLAPNELSLASSSKPTFRVEPQAVKTFPFPLTSSPSGPISSPRSPSPVRPSNPTMTNMSPGTSSKRPRGELDSESEEDDDTCALCGTVHELGKCPALSAKKAITDARRALMDPSNNDPPALKAAALEALKEKEKEFTKPRKKKQKVAAEPSELSKRLVEEGVTAPSKATKHPKTHHPEASLESRTPLAPSSPNKSSRTKHTSYKCPLCQAPSHLIADCPIAQDPELSAAALNRTENRLDELTRDILQKYRISQQKKQQAASTSRSSQPTAEARPVVQQVVNGGSGTRHLTPNVGPITKGIEVIEISD